MDMSFELNVGERRARENGKVKAYVFREGRLHSDALGCQKNVLKSRKGGSRKLSARIERRRGRSGVGKNNVGGKVFCVD